MGRAPCCEKMGLKKGPWTPEEDQILINYIQLHGHTNWRALPKQAGLLRCGKSCRLRWTNYLRPDIKRGNFTQEEEETIIKLHEMLGNRWSMIAARLPGRTDNEIKNVWHTHLKKRLPNYGTSSTEAVAATTTEGPTRKRARRSRVTKKSEVVQVKVEYEHVNCMEPEADKNNGSHNTHDDNTSRVSTSPILSDPVSPQPCTSEMSTVTSTSTSSASDNDNRSKGNVEVKGEYLEDLPEINDDFWMEVLAIEDTLDTAMSVEDYGGISHQCDPNSSSDLFAQEEPMLRSSSSDRNDMDCFWFNLLTRSDELPDMSEIVV